MKARAAITDALVPVYLDSNVSFEGRDYGPDFGSRIAMMPERFARQLYRRQGNRPAFLGPCTRDSQRCDTATDAASETTRCCITGALVTLEKVGQLCDRFGVPYFADYGSLLSVGCGGRWFWNDKDCDVGVPIEHQDTFMRMRSLFEAEGFTFQYSKLGAHQYGGGDRVKIRWSNRNLVNTDVFFWHRHDERNRCSAGGLCYSSGNRFPAQPTLHRRSYIKDDENKGREFPAAWAESFTRAPLEHLQVSVVQRWEALGAWRYDLPEQDGRPEHGRWSGMRAAIGAGVDPVEAGRQNFPAARHDGVKR